MELTIETPYGNTLAIIESYRHPPEYNLYYVGWLPLKNSCVVQADSFEECVEELKKSLNVIMEIEIKTLFGMDVSMKHTIVTNKN